MEETLLQLGLTDKESTVYLLLLKSPRLTAQQIADQTEITRTNTYRVIDNLLAQHLIVRDNSPVSRFSAAEPHALQDILAAQQLQLKQTAKSLSAAMPSFRSQYSLSTDKPGVVHMAGPDGFERLLEDMATSRTEVLLVASDDTPEDDVTLARFRELLMERKQRGVATRALFHDAPYRQRIQDEFHERGIDVRFIGSTPFKGEIALYEDNAAFTVYDPLLTTTVITNAHIADTHRAIFEELWQVAGK